MLTDSRRAMDDDSAVSVIPLEPWYRSRKLVIIAVMGALMSLYALAELAFSLHWFVYTSISIIGD